DVTKQLVALNELVATGRVVELLPAVGSAATVAEAAGAGVERRPDQGAAAEAPAAGQAEGPARAYVRLSAAERSPTTPTKSDYHPPREALATAPTPVATPARNCTARAAVVIAKAPPGGYLEGRQLAKLPYQSDDQKLAWKSATNLGAGGWRNGGDAKANNNTT